MTHQRRKLVAVAAVLFCLGGTGIRADENGLSAQVLEQYTQTVLSGSLRNLADFSAEIAPLNDIRIADELILIHAARHFEPDRLQVIIKSHTSLDIRDENGTTAVMHALMAGRTDNAQLLHEWGASLEGINNEGYSVRVLAENAGLPGFGPEPEFLAPDPDIEQKDLDQLLLVAAEAGDQLLVEWALSLGADISAQAVNGLQVAHVAALGGHVQTFDHVLSHESAPGTWATLGSPDMQDGPLSVIDFIIAGEGGGDHERAGLMLERAAGVPGLAAQMSDHRDRHRDAMMIIGYPPGMITKHFGAFELPAWDTGIPVWSDTPGGTPEEWQDLQRFLAEQGLYTGAVDGIPGRGTFWGVIRHTVRNLPELMDTVELMYDLSRTPDTAGEIQWQISGGKWRLSTAKDGLPLGYGLMLPEGVEPSPAFPSPERVSQGQTFYYNGSNENGTLTNDIYFTPAPPEENHTAEMRLLVMNYALWVVFYDDRVRYGYDGTQRDYTSAEPIQWPDALSRLR
ncbi:ankyrin repeat domain-containing protein [uncultured Roseobacter sp.]|uniref:ankyrin repeat domain-containing protein n=1 Tax=uncultured Roseobacter sp. TaxID=114847 RepID=UPI002619FE53|nr:ankyrin repeat domain-containing protein [uncultured Roseobacter sp.]